MTYSYVNMLNDDNANNKITELKCCLQRIYVFLTLSPKDDA